MMRSERSRTVYFIEVDYPEETAWRSIMQHSTPEDARAQWQSKVDEFPGTAKYPMRIIEEITTVVENELDESWGNKGSVSV